MAEKAKFEAWARKNTELSLAGYVGGFYDPVTQRAWRVWKAALASSRVAQQKEMDDHGNV